MFDYTLAVFEKTKKDIKRMCVGGDIFVQALFIILYAYTIIINIQNTIRLIIFSVLLAIALIFFVFNISTLRIDTKYFNVVVKRNIRMVVKYSKMILQLFSIGLTIYEIRKYGASDLTIVITATTVICFALQLLFEVARLLIERYIDLMTAAVKEDTKKLSEFIGKAKTVYNTVTNPNAAIAAAINKPLEYFANKIKGADENLDAATEAAEEPQGTEEFVSKREEKIHSKVCELGKKYKDERSQKRAEEKKQATNEEISKIKQHWQVISEKFKKKDKEN